MYKKRSESLQVCVTFKRFFKYCLLLINKDQVSANDKIYLKRKLGKI